MKTSGKYTEFHLEIATRLLTHECPVSVEPKQQAAASRKVYEALFLALSPIIGASGFRALVVRSVKLSRPHFPCLQSVELTLAPWESSERVADHLVVCLAKLPPGQGIAVGAVVYATFFGLVSALIGDALVAQIVKGVLPPPDVSNVSDKSEKPDE